MVLSTVGSQRCSPKNAMSIQRCAAQALAQRISSEGQIGHQLLRKLSEVFVKEPPTVREQTWVYYLGMGLIRYAD